MDLYATVVSFFQNGGPFMYPIGIVLFLGLAIAVERYFFLSFATVSNRRAFNQILPKLQSRDYQGVLDMAKKSNATVSKIVSAGIARIPHSQRRDDIEYAMEEQVMETLPRLEKRTQYLATLANVATLLGLLGTIMGLISAFTAVADADAAEKASLLSASISVAMNTTAFGLMAAIPLLLIHAFLQTKTTEIVDSLEMAGVKFLNLLADSGATSARTRTTDK